MKTILLGCLSLGFGLSFAYIADTTDLHALATVLAIFSGALGVASGFGLLGIGIDHITRK